ncbi:hypothetical protein [Streptomyces stackebrandtii]|uniref:hypothetical protein n=1 Tax=Streptomyces stackebrandtii TaxID=3051177 RepID=UPI0028DC511B|nr:hypothetical protein [Streptomyces sp. DSM 40976]
MPLLLTAGAAEGALLGAAQAHVLRRVLPTMPSRHWIAATAGAACLAWLLGMLPGVVAPHLQSRLAATVLAILAGILVLLSLGTAQWRVLRGTSLSPTVGSQPRPQHALAVFGAVATPLWHTGQSILLIASIGAWAGLLMAATVAAMTGLALLHLLKRHTAAGRARTGSGLR